jgi:hypothetical protein
MIEYLGVVILIRGNSGVHNFSAKRDEQLQPPSPTKLGIETKRLLVGCVMNPLSWKLLAMRGCGRYKAGDVRYMVDSLSASADL